MIDNNGDGIENVTYQFHMTIANGGTFLYNVGTISFSNGAYQNLNVVQACSVTKVIGDRSDTVLTDQVVNIASGLLTPPVNISPRSTPNYTQLVAPAVYSLSNGYSVFAGQLVRAADGIIGIPFFHSAAGTSSVVITASPPERYIRAYALYT